MVGKRQRERFRLPSFLITHGPTGKQPQCKCGIRYCKHSWGSGLTTRVEAFRDLLPSAPLLEFESSRWDQCRRTPEHQTGREFVFVAFVRGRIAFDLVQ